MFGTKDDDMPDWNFQMRKLSLVSTIGGFGHERSSSHEDKPGRRRRGESFFSSRTTRHGSGRNPLTARQSSRVISSRIPECAVASFRKRAGAILPSRQWGFNFEQHMDTTEQTTNQPKLEEALGMQLPGSPSDDWISPSDRTAPTFASNTVYIQNNQPVARPKSQDPTNASPR